MEEEDPKHQSLPDEIGGIMMSESEYVSLSKGGEIEKPKQQLNCKKEKQRKLRDRPVPPTEH